MTYSYIFYAINSCLDHVSIYVPGTCNVTAAPIVLDLHPLEIQLDVDRVVLLGSIEKMLSRHKASIYEFQILAL